MKKHRVLCIHGSRQSGELFKHRLRRLRPKLAHICDLRYIDAPHVHHNNESRGEPGESGETRTWWVRDEDGEWQWHANGLDKSLDLLKETWQVEGPFQGLIAFSSGGK
ncbi:unnamed protein product [Chrysoparadoxa australica]